MNYDITLELLLHELKVLQIVKSDNSFELIIFKLNFFAAVEIN